MNEADGELISVAGIGENGETYLGEKITLLNPTPEYDADEEAEEKEELVES